MIRYLSRALFLIVVSAISFAQAEAKGQRILVQSTTSTQNSGFYDYILPIFKAETGLDVNVVAVGTGQAIRNAMNGDADVLLVHAKTAEEKFVAEGYGVERFDLMYNDFVLTGPASDPSKVAQSKSLNEALTRLAVGIVPFVSRGDDSGTHKKERALWALAGLNPTVADPWYREVGAGMGATLRTAIEMGGYTLTDRATWIAYANKLDAIILFEGDKAMFNQYGIIALNPARFPNSNNQGAQTLMDWLLSDRGQSLIAAYRIDGKQLFFPNARHRD
jgi:tungstate transport system substrate-binding protein